MASVRTDAVESRKLRPTHPKQASGTPGYYSQRVTECGFVSLETEKGEKLEKNLRSVCLRLQEDEGRMSTEAKSSQIRIEHQRLICPRGSDQISLCQRHYRSVARRVGATTEEMRRRGAAGDHRADVEFAVPVAAGCFRNFRQYAACFPATSAGTGLAVINFCAEETRSKNALKSSE